MKNKVNILAPIFLILAALIWGISFIIMKNTLVSIHPALLIAIRFSLAAVLFFIISIKKLKLINKKVIIIGLFTGIFLGCAYIIQTFGLTYTTPGKNAFITSLYCLMVPFMYWLFNKEKPNKYNFIAVGIALLGLILLSIETILTFKEINFGDILTFISSVFYGLHIVFTNKYCKNYDVLLITLFQFISTSILAWITVFVCEVNVSFVYSGEMIISFLYLVVFATGLALLFQNYGIKNMDPNKGALLLSFESVFAVLISIIMGLEKILSLFSIFGFVLIFIAIFISETQLKIFKKK